MWVKPFAGQGTVKKKSPGVLLFVVLYSPDGRYDSLYLSNYASVQVKGELARVRGVGGVTLFGGQDYGLRVWLDPERLAARNLTAGDVVKALESQNAQVTGGPGAPYTVTTLGRLPDIEQFNDVILKAGAGGNVVRLKDVARVELGGDAARRFARLDGKVVVALGVSLLPQAPPRDVAAAVRERMEQLRKVFPEGLDCSLAFDLAPVWEAGGRATAPGYLLVEPASRDNLLAEAALKLVDRCGAILAKTEGVQHVLALSEDPFTRFGDGPCLLAQLAPDRKRADREGLLRAVRGQLGQVQGAEPRLRGLTGPAGYPVDLALRGPAAKDVREFGAHLADYEVFTGRTQAVETVDLRARVSGYLVQTPFKEGTDVKKGQILFEIDPRPYQAELEKGQGELQIAEAALKLARATYERDQAVAKSAPGTVGPRQFDQDRAAVEEAQARVKAAQAGIDIDKLNLDFTRVASPIDGRIGRRLVDPGNLVKADDTLLATVVSRDPMYVYFDIDERTVLRLRQLAQEGKIQAPREGETRPSGWDWRARRAIPGRGR